MENLKKIKKNQKNWKKWKKVGQKCSINRTLGNHKKLKKIEKIVKILKNCEKIEKIGQKLRKIGKNGFIMVKWHFFQISHYNLEFKFPILTWP